MRCVAKFFLSSNHTVWAGVLLLWYGAAWAAAPNDNWATPLATKLGVRLEAQFDSSGPDAWNPKRHPLVFITSEGPGYGGLLSGVKSPGLIIYDADTRAVVAHKSYDVLKPGFKNVFESHDNKYAYVSGGHTDVIYRYDTAANKITGRIRAGVDGPYGVHLSWDDKDLYTIGKGEGSHNRGVGLSKIYSAIDAVDMMRPLFKDKLSREDIEAVAHYAIWMGQHLLLRTLVKRDRFLPDAIEVFPGTAVQLVVRNTSQSPHKLASAEMGVAEFAVAGRDVGDVIWRAPDTEGSYKLQCLDCTRRGEDVLIINVKRSARRYRVPDPE